VDNPDHDSAIGPSVRVVGATRICGVELAGLQAVQGVVESWRGTDEATGEPREVVLVEVGSGPGPMGRGLDAAGRYVGVSGEGMLTVLAVAAHGERIALVQPELADPPLAAVLADRGGLSVGEAAAVGRAAARALGLLHDRGLAHGRVTAEALRLSASGPVLAEVGVAAALGTAGAPSDDVHELARLLVAAVADRDPAGADELRDLVGPALSGHPAARPSAAELAGLFASVPAEPVRVRPAPARRVVPEAAIPVVRQPRARWPLVVGAAALVLIVAAAVMVLAARHPDAGAAVPPVATAPPAPTGTPSTVAPSWQRILDGIAAARVRAYRTAEAAALAMADVPGSSADAVDRSRVAAWHDSGSRLAGGAPVVRLVRPLRTGTSEAELLVRESVAAYDIVDAAGHREHHPATGPRDWRVTLLLTRTGWLTASAGPAPA
jgi:hypothetical protein